MSLPTARRQFMLVLVLGAAGAGLAWFAVRHGWADVSYVPPAPLPAQRVTVTGQQLEPAAGALAVAGLACLAAVIATRAVLRRAAGVVLAGLGAGVVAAASQPVHAAAVIAAAASQLSSPSTSGGSTRSGKPTGGHPVVVGTASAHAALTGMPWRVAVIVGGLAIVAAGLVTVWRGPRWPVMSGRFDRQGRGDLPVPGRASPRGPGRPDGDLRGIDPAILWDSLSHGVDPTDGARDEQTGDARASARVAGPPVTGGDRATSYRADSPTGRDADARSGQRSG